MVWTFNYYNQDVEDYSCSHEVCSEDKCNVIQKQESDQGDDDQGDDDQGDEDQGDDDQGDDDQGDDDQGDDDQGDDDQEEYRKGKDGKDVDCETEFCNSGQDPQLQFLLVAAAALLYELYMS